MGFCKSDLNKAVLLKETQMSSITQKLVKSGEINLYAFPLFNKLEVKPERL